MSDCEKKRMNKLGCFFSPFFGSLQISDIFEFGVMDGTFESSLKLTQRFSSSRGLQTCSHHCLQNNGKVRNQTQRHCVLLPPLIHLGIQHSAFSLLHVCSDFTTKH